MTDKEIELVVKTLFTKMFNLDFSACEFGIECYKKGMEYQGIKELEIENENLIKQVRTLQTQIEKMKCCYNCSKWNEGLLLCNDSTVRVTTYADYCCEDWEIKEE